MKFFQLNPYFGNYDWGVNAAKETNELNNQVEGGFRSKINNKLPYWKEAPVFYTEMVHYLSDYPLHLLSSEQYKAVTAKPDFLPDVLKIASFISNSLHILISKLVISDRLKKLFEEFKIASILHFYEVKVKFKGENKNYWLVIPYNKNGRCSFIDVVDFTKMKVGYVENDEFIFVEPDEIEKGDKNYFPYRGENRTLYLKELYDVIELGGRFYISERLKSEIEKKGMTVPIAKTDKVQDVIFPEKT